jgi:hypothetical protein
MHFEAKAIDPNAIAYSTCGNWEWLPNDYLKVTVPDFGNREDSAFLVALHELVEAWLCKSAGILESDVSKWDIEHPELEEPGDHPEAPYHEQHRVATEVEKLVNSALRRDWDDHEGWVQAAAEEVDRSHETVPETPRILREGSRYWAELHLFALRHNGKQSAGWLKDWVESLPFDGCPCKKHLEQHLGDNPPVWNDFFVWTIELHNAVNIRIGKPLMDVENARQYWGSRLF